MKNKPHIREGKYFWKDGVNIPVSAQAYGEWEMSLPDQQPSTIVEAARKDKNCVAHKLFPWDLEKAALEHWLTIARKLHGSLVVEAVVYKRDKPFTYQVKALVRGGRDGPYEPIAHVMRNAEKRDYLLAQCMRELSSIRREYATLSELAVVFAAIDDVEVVVKRKRKARG